MKHSFRVNLVDMAILALLVGALLGCTTPTPVSEKLPGEIAVAPAPTKAAEQLLPCVEDYTRHELPREIQWDQHDSQPVYTLDPDDFDMALQQLGISSICVPEGVGAPYLRLDSGMFNQAAVKGAMSLYRFDQWPDAQLVYSTYDVSMPTEYDTFATAADYEAMQSASLPGFERISVGQCYGRCTVYRTFVYAFPDHYVAVTLDLGAYEYGPAVDEAVAKFSAGEYPSDAKASLQKFDTLVRGLQFGTQ